MVFPPQKQKPLKRVLPLRSEEVTKYMNINHW